MNNGCTNNVLNIGEGVNAPTMSRGCVSQHWAGVNAQAMSRGSLCQYWTLAIKCWRKRCSGIVSMKCSRNMCMNFQWGMGQGWFSQAWTC